ncbi:MAG: hypothetical protein KIT33_08365 [Candidatus Kapabacteria bacterium]|nr:hypothetical protein [Ignavibacteriota bacterium]MCW5884968.1 hypothetical protein [Candidatus Kapabacteria bacterium]
MKLRFLLAFLILIMVIPGSNLLSQGSNPLVPDYKRPPVYIGPVLGYNRSMHTVDLASFDDAICPRFEDGQSNGFFVGLSFEQHLGKDALSSTSSFIFRVLYNTMPASLEVSENPIPSLITIVDGAGNPQGEDVINSSTLHTQDITYSLVTAEVMYKINPIPGIPLGFVVGPTFDFAMARNQDQRYKLVQPLEAQFRRNQGAIDQFGYQYVDNDRTIIVKEGEIPESSGFRFGIKAGMQFELTAPGFVVVPGIAYNFGITNLSTAENWRVNALQVGVDVRFAL